MTEPILRLLTRLSEAGSGAVLPGGLAQPYRGPAFDRLLAKRILVEAAPLTHWEVCDDCSCGLVSRPVKLRGEEFLAECPLDGRQDVALIEEDLTVFRIGAKELASAISAAAGFTGTAVFVADGLWTLGRLPNGRYVILAFSADALAHPMAPAALRAATEGAEATILSPTLSAEAAQRLRGAEFHLVETTDVLAALEDRTVVGLDPAIFSPARANETFLVRKATAELHWRGRRVQFTRQIFPVFLRLVEMSQRRGEFASHPYLEDTTGRVAKDLMREVRKAFTAAGFAKAEIEPLIQSERSRGYRLTLGSDQIVVES